MNMYKGSKLDDFAVVEGLLAQAQPEAIKHVLVWQLEKYMKEEQLKK